MSEPKVLFEDHGNIAVIKLNRPEKRNALDPETVMMFNEFSEKAKDPKFRAVIVTGDESAFVAAPISPLQPQKMVWVGKVSNRP